MLAFYDVYNVFTIIGKMDFSSSVNQLSECKESKMVIIINNYE